MLRNSSGHNDMRMLYGEFNYRHSFTDKHFLDFTVDYHNWRMDQENIYQDSTTYIDPTGATEYDYQYRPMYMRNHSWEVKLDYENPIADGWLLQEATSTKRRGAEQTPWRTRSITTASCTTKTCTRCTPR